MKKWLFLVLLGLLFDSSAATYYVSTSGRSGAAGTEADPYGVIQDAVNKAAAGDTVVVGPGAYSTENSTSSAVYARVYIKKNITLASSMGALATHIVGSGAATYGTAGARRCIYVEKGCTPYVKGFTLREGTTVANGYGGGIFYDGEGVSGYVIAVQNCIVRDNSAAYGGGLYSSYTPRVCAANCVVVNNTAKISGGANGVANMTLLQCYLDNGATGYEVSSAFSETFRTYVRNCAFSRPNNSCLQPNVVAANNAFDAASQFDGSYRPLATAGSLVLNAGTSTLPWGGVLSSVLPQDGVGNLRENGNPDIGPTEWWLSAATNVAASSGRSDGVMLTWGQDVPDASQYNIYRGASDDLMQAQRVGTNVSSGYVDGSAPYRTPSHYWIQATNNALLVSGTFIAHSFSDSASGSRLTLTNELPTFSPPSGSVFTNSTYAVVRGMNIYYRVNGGTETYSATDSEFLVAADTVITAQSRSDDKWDSGIATSTLYRAYQLIVGNQTNHLVAGTATNITAREIANRPFIGWSGYTNSTERTILLTMPPEDVVLTAAYEPAVGQVGPVVVSPNTDRILLEWTVVSGALLYEVQRADSIEGAFVSIAQTDLAFHQDTTAVPGRTYCYKVRAFAVPQAEEEQAGLFSEVVSGTRPALLEVVASGFVQPLASPARDCSLLVTANMDWTAVSRVPWMTLKSTTTQGAVFAATSNSDTTNSRTGVIRFILGSGVLTNDYSVTQSGNLKPDQPVGISPVGTGVDPFNVLLTASPYSDAEGDAQSNTEWRVNGVVTANPIERLSYATDYVWQVRYQDPYSWSDWSTALSFSTLVPELSASLAGTNAPKEGLVFDFTVTSNCQWEVVVDAAWLGYTRNANQVSVTVERNTGDARTGTLGIHPLGTNGWMQTVTVDQAEWPIPPTPIPLLPVNNAVVTGSVRLVLQTVGGISNTEWRINGHETNLMSVAARFTNSVLIQRGVTNFWSARFTDGVRWSASSETNQFYWMKKDTVYVSTNGNDFADGESWEQAFRTIQKGIDSVPVGGTVLVGSGVYSDTNVVMAGLKAVVTLTKSVNLRSVGGAEKTVIQARLENGSGRCMYIVSNVVVEGFSLVGGKTKTNTDQSGWGAAVYSENNLQPVFRSCIISNNVAQNGIIYQNSGGFCVFDSCLFVQNVSDGNLLAGGSFLTNRFFNCTLARNTTSAPNLLNKALLYNTLVVSNANNTIASLSGSNNSIGTFSAAHFVDFAGNDFRLLPSAASCIDKGTTNFIPYVLGQTDLAGKPRIQGRHPDIGAYETTPPPPTILRVF